MKSEMPFTPGISLPSGPGILASTRWTIFSDSSCSPAEIHILLPRSRYCAPSGDSPSYSARVVMSDSDEPACGSDRHMVPKKRPSISGLTKVSTCAGVPCVSSRLALPMVRNG
ncbi:hypothetical protein D3C72_1696260 [compost metagenome]